MAGKANPPFTTADGKPVSPGGGGASGARDFTKENRPQGGDEKGGASFNGNNSGGRDFTQESRPQPAMKTQAGLPNAETIPEGGKILKADPGPVSQKVSGTAQPLANHKPFRTKG
jgi:hypothetical protein